MCFNLEINIPKKNNKSKNINYIFTPDDYNYTYQAMSLCYDDEFEHVFNSVFVSISWLYATFPIGNILQNFFGLYAIMYLTNRLHSLQKLSFHNTLAVSYTRRALFHIFFFPMPLQFAVVTCWERGSLGGRQVSHNYFQGTIVRG